MISSNPAKPWRFLRPRGSTVLISFTVSSLLFSLLQLSQHIHERLTTHSPLLVFDSGKEQYHSGGLPPPPLNKNWAQKDQSSTIRLGFGSPIGLTYKNIHSTFRGNWDMGGYEVSCQLWRKGKLNFVDPGWNPYLVGAGSFWFQQSLKCGQCLLIKNPINNRSIVAQIADYCPPPGCKPKQLDIQAAGAAFLNGGASTDRRAVINHHGLHVTPVECDWKALKLGYYFSRGSGRFHWYLIIFGSTVPIEAITKISLLDGAGRVVREFTDNIKHDGYGRWVVEFGGNGGKGVYRLEMRGMQRLGESKEANILTDTVYFNGREETRTIGTTNFPLHTIPTDIPQWPL